MENNLVEISSINPIKVFTEDGMDELLLKIERESLSFVPDLSTASSRKKIASLARKISSSKVIIDNAGKELTSEWKAKSKLVDQSRKQAREFLDALKIRVRKPLTEHEENEGHQRIVNQGVYEDFVSNGIDEVTAKKITVLLAKNIISNVTINY